MTKRLTGFSVLAVTLLVMASVPMFNQPTAVAQVEGGGIGACITLAGCGIVFESTCTSFDGIWLGEGSSCETVSTACCLVNGACVVLTPELCAEAGGTSSGFATPCSQITCDQPCYGDVDGDGTVGILDFLDLLAAWGDCK